MVSACVSLLLNTAKQHSHNTPPLNTLTTLPLLMVSQRMCLSSLTPPNNTLTTLPISKSSAYVSLLLNTATLSLSMVSEHSPSKNTLTPRLQQGRKFCPADAVRALAEFLSVVNNENGYTRCGNGTSAPLMSVPKIPK